MLNSRKASRNALALHRSERHPTPDSEVAGPTNRPRIDAHGLNQRSQFTQCGGGSQDEIGNAAATRSLNKAAESRHPVIARPSPEDVYARLRSDVQPVGANGTVSWNQATAWYAEAISLASARPREGGDW